MFPAPSVPTGNQCSEDLVAALGDEEHGRGTRDQPLDVAEAVGGACVLASRLSQKLQDRLRVLAPTGANRDSLAG
jgi:hypothetical protein